MLKHRNYLTISAFFLLVFLLFQIVVIDAGMDVAMTTNKLSDINLNAPSFPMEIPETDEGGGMSSDEMYNAFYDMKTQHPSFAVLTDSSAESAKLAKDTSTLLNYMQMPNRIYTSIDEAYADSSFRNAVSRHTRDEQTLKGMIITTPNIDSLGSIDTLLTYLSESGNVIFCALPSTSSAAYQRLESVVGIMKNYGEYTQKGFDIYEGILLSGVFSADTLEFRTSRVELLGKCKVYAVAKEPGKKNEEKNPLIWRTYYNRAPQGSGSTVFVSNGPFIMDKDGAGILSGIISQLDESIIYPIIDSKAVVLENFPFVADRNSENLKNLYNRGMLEFTRDIIWSDLMSIKWESSLLYTSYIGGNISEDTRFPDKRLVEFLTKETVKSKGEMGFTIPNSLSASGSFGDLVNKNADYLKTVLPQYQIHSYLEQKADEFKNNKDSIIAAFPKLGSVLTDWENSNFSYVDENIVTVPTISKGFYYDETQSWKLLNMASAIGVIVHSLNMEEPIMRKTEDDDWRNLSIEAAKNLSFQLNKIRWVEADKISDLVAKFKNFATTRSHVEYNEYNIKLNIENFSGMAKFIFRTNKKVVSYRNCTLKEVSDGIYILDAKSDQVTIDIQYKH